MNSTKNWSIITSIFITLLMVILALNYWPNADDFCFRNKVDDHGLINYIKDYYLHWSGRIMTLFFVGVLIKIFPLDNSIFISSFFVLLFSLACYLTSRFINRVLIANDKTLFPLLLLTFWFGLRGIIGEIVYWPTGAGVYLIPYLFCFIWLKRTYDDFHQERKFKFDHLLINFILSLICGNAIEMLSPSLITFVVFFFLLNRKNLNSYQKLDALFKIIALIIGALILIMAPGNFERAKEFPQGVSFNIPSLISNFFNVTFVFFSFSKTLLFFVAIASFLLILLNTKIAQSKQKLRAISLAFLLMALSELIPMSTIDVHFATRRTTFYFGIFLSIALMTFIFSFKNSWSNFKLSKHSSKLLWSYTFIVSISIILDIKSAYPIRNNFLVRHQQLSSSTEKNKIFEIPPLTSKKVPKSLFFEEITEDSSYWVNSCMRRYYRVDGIKLMQEIK